MRLELKIKIFYLTRHLSQQLRHRRSIALPGRPHLSTYLNIWLARIFIDTLCP
jgi:hypothetical protein